MQVESEWDLVDWTRFASGLERAENDSDRGMNLGMPSESGSRPVEDRIHEHEERCQEQEDSLPMSSTKQVQVEGELDCSP